MIRKQKPRKNDNVRYRREERKPVMGASKLRRKMMREWMRDNEALFEDYEHGRYY